MRNARLGEAKAGIKIAVRNINNLRCADDTTLMAESEEHSLALSFFGIGMMKTDLFQSYGHC